MNIALKMLLKQLIHGRWRVVRTGWPYKVGYGTYRKRYPPTLLDSGLTRDEAQERCDELNSYGVEEVARA